MKLQINQIFLLNLLCRRAVGLAITLGACLFMPFVAESDPFFFQIIERETTRIKETAPTEYQLLADAYSTRGESYLLLDQDRYALEDFLSSYEYSLLVEGDDQTIPSLRALFGAFLVYARMENLEQTQLLVEPLSQLIHKCAKCECKPNSTTPFVAHSCSSTREQEQKDWPILGSDYVSMEECEDRAKRTARTLYDLLDRVRNHTIQALATAMVSRMASEAKRCCQAGNAWKGCLQRLTNKYHYWQLLGVPSTVSYYREEE